MRSQESSSYFIDISVIRVIAGVVALVTVIVNAIPVAVVCIFPLVPVVR